MSKLKKIGAGVGGVGILLLAIYLAAFLFVILLIVGVVAGIYLYFKGGKLRKEFERRQAEANSGTIDADYVVVEEQVIERKPPENR